MENGKRIEIIQIHNRYGNPIEFSRISDNKFIMSGGQWYRMGFDSEKPPEENKFVFADPSGGPYISQGMTMGYVNQGWMGKIVHYCSWANRVEELKDISVKENDILITTYPELIMKATVNNVQEFRIYSPEGNVIETTDNFNDAVKWIEDKYERR
jgi:hypothetical protein